MKKSGNLYVYWSIAIVLCVTLALFSLLFVSCSKSNPDPSPSPSESVSPSPSPADTPAPPDVDTNPTDTSPTDGPSAQPSAEPDGVVLGETEDMGQDYVDKFVFLGDSTTYGLKAYSMLSGGQDTTQVWTPASGTLTLSQQSFATIVYPESGAEITIKAAAEAKQPEYMLITLGVNGVSFMDETSFTAEYTSLVNSILEVSPNTKIIINSIYPTCSDYQYKDSISLEKILAANEWLKAVAEDTGTRYLDTISVLQGADGYLPVELSNGDGIHLSPDGFTVVLNYLRTHGYED